MEDNNSHPSLPSNYVTLAQLQERWLKQKEKEKQLQEQEKHDQQQQIPKLHQNNPRREYGRGRRPISQQQAWRVIETHPTGTAGKRPPPESGPKNPKVSESNRVGVEVSREKNESLEVKADTGDGIAGQVGKKKESKKKGKSSNRKPRADEGKKKLAEDALQSIVERNKEAAHSNVQKVDDKTETKIELNVSKSNNLMVEVEQKLGALSTNSGNDQQNSRLRSYNSFRGSQRNYGGRSYRTRPYGDRFRGQEVHRGRIDQQIWVRKNDDSNGNADRNEISNGTKK